MFASRQYLLLFVTLGALLCACLAVQEPDIKEDVIEIENQTQKVIRVNPLELPSRQDIKGSHMNSELFQVQTLRPGAKGPRQRHYKDSKQMRRPKIAPMESLGERTQPALKFTYSPELKAFPKQKLKMKQQKQLHFPIQSRANPADEEEEQMHTLPIQVTPGAYPIYYVVSKTNGRFGKFPIKSFRSPAEFAKYLIKSKAEPIPRYQRFEGKGDVSTQGSVVSR